MVSRPKIFQRGQGLISRFICRRELCPRNPVRVVWLMPSVTLHMSTGPSQGAWASEMQPLTQPVMSEPQGLLGYPTQSPHLTTLLGVKSYSWLASQLQISSLPSLFPLLIAYSSPCHWCRFRLPTHNKPNAETMRFAAEKKKQKTTNFFFKAAKQGDRRTSLNSVSPKAKGQGYL